MGVKKYRAKYLDVFFKIVPTATSPQMNPRALATPFSSNIVLI
tara:strand:+ start:535 stop:663 length:129 start_codon:yes stop_codon:yes gene_type:complete